MKVKVSSVLQGRSGPIVHFTCAAGEAAMVWHSRKVEPIEGREYDVEFNVAPVIQLGENAKLEPGFSPSLQTVGAKIQITGIVEGVEADNIAYLRLSTDCILMVEFAGSPPRCGDVVRTIVDAEKLKGFPFGS